jgi:hyperosmotically inducible protein
MIPARPSHRTEVRTRSRGRKAGAMKTGTSFLKIGLYMLLALAVATLTIGIGSAHGAAIPSSQSDTDLLNKQVHHALVMLPWYGVFDNLEYSIDGSEVTLSGQALQPITKSDAEAAIKRLKGVTRVVNQITVLPLLPFDNQIRRAELRAIFSDAVLSRYSMGPVPSIHILVDRGHVTLEGAVSNEMDRRIATIRANTVPGVFSVSNNLRIG